MNKLYRIGTLIFNKLKGEIEAKGSYKYIKELNLPSVNLNTNQEDDVEEPKELVKQIAIKVPKKILTDEMKVNQEVY